MVLEQEELFAVLVEKLNKNYLLVWLLELIHMEVNWQCHNNLIKKCVLIKFKVLDMILFHGQLTEVWLINGIKAKMFNLLLMPEK